ncbi:MAG: hypothetical protein IPM29_21200 [Planctomycetes bacterium]|nr:hypothetical protein [Planctomycetota bacterium]
MSAGRRLARGALRALALLALAGCGVAPYQPLRVELAAPVGAPGLERAAEALRVRFPSLAPEPGALRMASGWERCTDAGWPAKRRLFAFVEPPGTIALVVEISYLRIDLWGEPEWTTPRGDPRAEREAAELVRAALAGAARPAG